MAYTVSEYFSDEMLESQLRMHFSLEEMWNIDFKALFSQIVDTGNFLQLKIKNRTFRIDKITGDVQEVK